MHSSIQPIVPKRTGLCASAAEQGRLGEGVRGEPGGRRGQGPDQKAGHAGTRAQRLCFCGLALVDLVGGWRWGGACVYCACGCEGSLTVSRGEAEEAVGGAHGEEAGGDLPPRRVAHEALSIRFTLSTYQPAIQPPAQIKPNQTGPPTRPRTCFASSQATTTRWYSGRSGSSRVGAASVTGT